MSCSNPVECLHSSEPDREQAIEMDKAHDDESYEELNVSIESFIQSIDSLVIVVNVLQTGICFKCTCT